MEPNLRKPVRRGLLALELEQPCFISASSQDAVAPVPLSDPNRQLTVLQPSAAVPSLVSGWNLAELLERVEGDRPFLRELLVMFRDDSKNSLQRAKDAFVSGNLLFLSLEAHRLKGMLKNLAMGRSAELAGMLEIAAHNNNAPKSQELLLKLQQALAEIQPEVESQLTEANI